MKVGYSATIWDNGRSGIGTYIAEQIDLLHVHDAVDLRVIEYGGRILTSEELPQTGSSSTGKLRNWRPIRDILWHRRSLRSLASKEKFDLVHIPTIRRLPGKLPCPVVATVHDLGPVRLKQKYGLLRGAYHHRIVPKWLRNVDAIVTPSRSTKNDLIELYEVDPEKITVVPNGVNHSLYRRVDPLESSTLLKRTYNLPTPFFVYISRLEHPSKNHLRLLEAFARARQQHELPHKLVLVGPRWNGYEVIEQAARPLMEAGAVVMTDYVPREHLPHLLGMATALVYPSLFEGFGLPVLEAMACGTPVACSRSSSLTEIADGKGILFDPRDVDGMADAMARLASDEALRDQLSAVGAEHALRFTWSRSVNETVAVWRKVLEQRA